MNKVYIISRYRGATKKEQDHNVATAQYFAREELLDNKLPIVPHIYFTQFLDDSDAFERGYGLELGLGLLKECDEFLLVIIDGKISEGMAAELKEVSRLALPGRIVSLTGKELYERVKKHIKR